MCFEACSDACFDACFHSTKGLATFFPLPLLLPLPYGYYYYYYYTLACIVTKFFHRSQRKFFTAFFQRQSAVAVLKFVKAMKNSRDNMSQ